MKEKIKNEFKDKVNETISNLESLNSKDFLENLSKSLIHILNSLKSGNKIIFCGNGGSAADSQHLAGELVAQFLNKKRKSIPAISLTTNTSTITAIANDIDFKNIFSRQIQSLGKSKDILFCISTSGKSKNIIEALKTAKKNKMITILLTGKSKIKNKLIDFQINVNGNRVDRIQEQHIMIGHYICEFLENNI